MATEAGFAASETFLISSGNLYRILMGLAGFEKRYEDIAKIDSPERQGVRLQLMKYQLKIQYVRSRFPFRDQGLPGGISDNYIRLSCLKYGCGRAGFDSPS